MSFKKALGQTLFEQLTRRGEVQSEAATHGEATETFVVRFPMYRLYKIRRGAPYVVTTPGSLVRIIEYDLPGIATYGESAEEADVARAQVVRTADGKWVDGRAFWISPQWMERVDEEEYGVELEAA